MPARKIKKTNKLAQNKATQVAMLGQIASVYTFFVQVP